MSNQPENFDFFVSYARSDNVNGWIARFIEELLAEHKRFSSGRELKPFFDQHAITTGADWQLYLAHGIAHSRLFLAFLSPNYFASEWCRKEWRAWMDAEIAQHILTAGVRPIYIVEVPGLTGKGQLSDQQLAQKLAELSKLPASDRARLIAETPPVVKHLRRRQLTHNQPFCDVHAFFDAGLDALRREDLRQVLDQLAHDLDHHAALLAQAAASLSTVPAYNKHFTGRLDELLLLRERLIKDDRTGVIYGIQGLGGIGKTELAFTYAHAYASAYPGGRFLIRCEGKSVLRDAVLGQSDFTGLFGEQISDEERKLPDAYFAAILRCLRARLDQLGHILLVLDNVSDLALLGHQQTQALTALGPQLHLLATTRLIPPAGGKGNWLSLGQLPDDDALDLMEKYRPFATAAEREAAGRIVKRLGGFTLAVELAAAHLAEHPDVTCARMADIIGLEDLENPVVVESADLQNIRYEHDRRLSAVLGPTLAALTPAERRALEYAALLPPDYIPLPWLKTLVVADFPEIGQPARLTDLWSDLWRHLEKLALFTRPEEESGEPRLMRVHRLVQELMLRELPHEERTARQQAVDALVEERAAALKNETRLQESRWELEPLGALADLWADAQHPRASALLYAVGVMRFKLGMYSLMEHSMYRALELDQKKLGPNHPKVARTFHDLAWMCLATNRLGEAESLMRRSLSVNETSFGPDHPDVALSLGGLAIILRQVGRNADAEPLLRRALAIDEKRYGGKTPAVARDLANLASLLRTTNRPIEAESMFVKALELYEQQGELESDEAASIMNNLAILLSDTNRRMEGELLSRRVLKLLEKIYGEFHPSVAQTSHNLAMALKGPGLNTARLDEAETLLRRALSINEHFFDPKHPEVVGSIKELAEFLQATNRSSEAASLLRRLA
jgi:tetratricopeptide (TPR) repeat protein